MSNHIDSYLAEIRLNPKGKVFFHELQDNYVHSALENELVTFSKKAVSNALKSRFKLEIEAGKVRVARSSKVYYRGIELTNKLKHEELATPCEIAETK